MSVQSPIRVLLVEDHPVNQKVVTRMLQRLGCTVEVAADGLIGVERAASRPSMILMDCSMPRCDGFEATRRIRANESGARTPIVALTAHATPADRDRCLAAGMDHWLPKPVSTDDLVRTLERYTTWESPEKQAANGVLDPKITQRLIDLAPDEPEFFASLVVDFCAAAGAAVGEARARLATSQWVELRRAVHKLKSASATIGALRVHAACVRIEQAGETELAAQGAAWFEAVDEEVGRAADALRAAPGVLT